MNLYNSNNSVFISFFLLSLEIERQTDQCDVCFIKCHRLAVFIFNGNCIFIIFFYYSNKLFLSVDCPVSTNLYFFSQASCKVFFFLQRSVKSRRADLHNVAVLDEILLIQYIAECTAYVLAVIDCDSARFVDIASEIPGSGFLDLLHIYQFKAPGLHDRCKDRLCLLFIFFPSAHASHLPFLFLPISEQIPSQQIGAGSRPLLCQQVLSFVHCNTNVF